MPEQEVGTLEAIGLELSKVFIPLKERVEAGEILLLLAELGVDFPSRLIDAPGAGGFTDAVTGVTDKVDDMINVVKALMQAIKEEEYGTTAEKSIELVELIAGFVEDFQTIADEINSKGPYTDISGPELSAYLEDFAVNLLEYLLIGYLKTSIPLFVYILEFFGIVEETIENEGSLNPAVPQYTKSTFHFNRVSDFLDNPATLAQNLYGWGGNDAQGNPFTGDKLFQKSAKIISAIGWPAVYDNSGAQPELDLLMFRFEPRTDLSPRGIEISVDEPLSATTTQTISLGNSSLELGFNGSLGVGTSIIIQPNGNFEVNIPPALGIELDGGASIKWIAKNEDNTPFVIFGSPTASRLEAKEISTMLSSEFNWDVGASKADVDVGFEFEIKEGKVIIKPGSPDGFLAQILPEDGITAEFNILAGIETDRGFYFEGSGGLKIQFPTNLSLGPILIQALAIEIGVGASGIPIGIGANVGLEIGPFAAIVEGLGVKLDITFPDDKKGNLGPVDMDIGFKPPTGVGLSLDAGLVKGGGFLRFDFEAGKYTGILQLSIKEVVNVVAIGIITTKGPNGEEGQFSMLLLITAEFTPIQLGFGFTLNGVGGLIGVHRTMNLDALRSGVRTNALDNILFPSNPIANATQIISDLETVFPQQQNRYSFGLMGKLGWGTPTLISLEIGLMLEVPNPVALAILGVIKMVLPTEEEALLKLQVNFVGIIDFEAKYITFDASLFDSKLLTFTLEGDMALRIKWGSDSNFLFSVGGFHPSYTPPPLDLPEMKRLTIGLLTGNPRLTVTSYFAVTSNTVQFGAAVDFYFGVSGFKVIGYLHFDALFQFNPFYFNISLAAGLGVYLGSSEILSIHLSGSLEGPTPWHITGKIKFKIFWVVNVNVSVETTWGETRNTSLPDIDVMPKLLEALENKANWLTPLESTGDNPDQLVSLRTIENDSESIIAHPNRSLSVSQKVVPLDINIDKFGTQNPADYQRFELELTDDDDVAFNSNNLKEEFAPDSFFSLKESEKLSRPSFEKYNSGLEGTGSSELTSDYFRVRDVEYEQIILDEPDPAPVTVGMAALEFASFVRNGSIAKSALSYKNSAEAVLAPNKITIADDAYTIVNINDLSAVNTIQHGSIMEAEQAMQTLMTDQPELADQLEIIPSFELDLV
ncbi:MAG: DUF6603 domain-containing protein [Bacteroidota bacterium]